ncbi:MAG: hypothetical protein PHU06_12235 [Gallionella sp.]|nr:hypothetical protein [Gallionella sp.]MDD4960000.1 hypothetical protein [Gallionella sp.]
MFKQLIPDLLAGKFICAYTDHDAFYYLNDAHNFAEVNDYLGKIGLKLSTTRHGGAFFCTHIDINSEDKKAAKVTFKDIKHNLRPLVGFLDLLMRTMQRDDLLVAGALIEVNQMMTVIDGNPSFRNELQSLATQASISDSKDRGRLSKLLEKFKNNGYLNLVNPEREIYCVTGKIEYIQQVIEFLMEYGAVPEVEETDTPQTGGLF